MPRIALDQTVGELVAAAPELARLFEELQIDYCCHGNTQLGDACLRKSLDSAHVLNVLSRSEGPAPATWNWVTATLTELCDHIEQTHHMMKEKQILFPAIRALEQASQPLHLPFGTVENPIQMMEYEHEVAGDALAKLRELTNGYQIPKDACNSYCAMLQGLHDLGLDLHQHIHKENNILFPRATQREAGLNR